MSDVADRKRPEWVDEATSASCGGCPHPWRYHDDGEYGCLLIDRRTRSGFCSCQAARPSAAFDRLEEVRRD